MIEGLIAGLGSGAVQSGINAFWNSSNLADQYYYNNKMYQQQLKDAGEWYKNVQSPMALRKQYEEAGFSPYASLGQQGASAPSPDIGQVQQPENPFSGLSGNVTRAMDMFRNELNDSVQRESMIQDIASKKLENAKSQLEYDYMKDNYILDKNAERTSKLKGFNLGEASSADNYIRNGANYSYVGKIYENFQNILRHEELKYQRALTDKTISEKERLEAGRDLDRLREKLEPIMHRMQISLMKSQKDELDFNNAWVDRLNQDKIWDSSNNRFIRTKSFELMKEGKVADAQLGILGLLLKAFSL